MLFRNFLMLFSKKAKSVTGRFYNEVEMCPWGHFDMIENNDFAVVSFQDSAHGMVVQVPQRLILRAQVLCIHHLSVTRNRVDPMNW